MGKQRGQEGIGRRGQPGRDGPAAESPEVEQEGLVAGGDLCFLLVGCGVGGCDR